MSTNWGREEIPALRDFSRWADEYTKTPATSRAKLRVNGIKLAQARRTVMLQLIAKDPAQAIASAIPATLESELPEDILEHAERRISGIGDLDVIGITPKSGAPKGTRLIQRIARFDNESYKVSVYGRLANAGAREQIPMHGVVIDDQAALMDSSIRVLEPGEPLDPAKEIVTKTNHPISRILANRDMPANSPPAFAESGNKIYCLHCVNNNWDTLMSTVESSEEGTNYGTEPAVNRAWNNIGTNKKMLVTLVDFPNLAGGVVTQSTAQSRCSDLNTYYQANSHGKLAYSTMDVTPVLRMPQPTSHYVNNENYWGLANDAISAATNAGYNPNNYQFFVVAFKGIYDYWAGRGTVGKSYYHNYSVSWLNGESMSMRVFSHELGHNLGMFHAASWNPDSSTQPDDSAGSSVEYGNPFDSMGLGNSYDTQKTPFTVHYKNLLDWVPDVNIPTVGGNYSGRIYAADRTQVTGRNYAIRIDSNRALGGKSNLDYWAEYRSLITENSYSQNGAMIYLSDPEGTSGVGGATCRLLDMKPGTSTFNDAPLQNGSSFTDANNRWKIRVNGKGGSGSNSYLDITVTDLNLPVITTHPVSSGVVAGGSYTLTVGATGGSLSYQWRKNGTNIPGAIGPSYTIPPFSLANEGNYDVRVTNSTGSVYSESVVVYQKLGTIDASNASDNFTGSTRDSTKWGPADMIQGAGRFSRNGYLIYSTQGTPTTDDYAIHQWHPQGLPYNEDWSVQVDVNVPALTMTPDSLASVGLFLINQDDPDDNCQFTLTRSEDAGALSHGFDLMLDVNDNTAIEQGAPNATTNAAVRYDWNSATQTLRIEYDANGPIGGYSWTPLRSTALNSGNTNWGMNSSSSFAISTLGISANLTLATGDGVWLDNFSITGYPPFITTHPVSQTAAQNSNVNFTVVASGTPLTYQWQKNGVNLPGAISATLLLNSVVVSDSGNYHCVVSNTAGSATSNIATLTVIDFYKKWEFETGGEVYSSPAFGADGTVYFGSDDNKTYALNPDGTKKWEFETGGFVRSSPAIGSDGTVYVGSDDNKVYALDGASGAKKWEFETGDDVESSPAIGSDGTVYIGSYDNKVYALDGATGAKKWEFVTGGDVFSSPSIGSDGTVYVGSDDNKVYALGGASGAKKWEFVTGGWVFSSPAIGSNGTVYVGSYDKKVYALNGASGAKKWEFETGGFVRSSPAIGSDGTVYVVSWDNKAYALDGATGAKKWEFETGDRVHSSPAIGAGNTVYVGSTDNKVYALDGASGAKKWEFETGAAVYSSPAIGSDGTVYVGSWDKKVYALQTASMGLAKSPWPKFHQNNRNTGLSPWPLITSHPTSLDLVSGSSATFSITAHGGVPLSYQWQKQDANGSYSNIADTNSTSYTINPIATGDAGTYRCVVSNSHGLVTSNPAPLIVGIAPVVTTQPVSQNVIVGTNPTFTVVATGTTPLSYQWQKDGTNIPDTNSSSYTITSAQSDDNGSYSCIISNKYASATSNSATLLVGYAPTIASHPASADQVAGSSVTFSITLSTGTTPITYQWQKNNVDISGATSISYTIASLTTGHAGSYHCIASNGFGSAASSPATLIVGIAPAVTTHPVSQNVIVGTSPTFTVVATGTIPLSYQWQKDGTDIPDTNSSSYAITSAQSDDNGSYRCIVSNKYASATSNSATLLVGYAPAIDIQPVSADQVAGSSVTFSISLSAGSTPLSYQWQKDGADINGANSASYSIASLTTDHNGSYRCIASNPFGTVASNAATLTVGVTPVVTNHPANQNAIVGTSPTFTVTATGTAPLSYQWQKDGTNISGATSASYTIDNVQIDANGTTYRCYISNKYGNVTSSSATLAVGYVPAFASHPADADKEAGSSVTFLITLSTGTEPVSYQWQKDGEDISGATDASYTIDTLSTDHAGDYRCIASNKFGSATSNAATLTIGIPPAITSQPADQNATIGSNPTFIVVATGTEPLSYQWQKDGVDIPDTNSSSYTIANVTTGFIGNYQCIVSNKYATTTSDYAALNVGRAPSIILSPVTISALTGSRVTLNAAALGNDPLTYQWQKDNVNVDISNTFTIAKYYPQYSSSTYKWFKDAADNWVYIIPQGLMYHKQVLRNELGVSTETRRIHNYDKSLWDNPWFLVGRNFYTIDQAQASDSATYRCVLYNRFGSAVTDEAALSVSSPPAITYHPYSQDLIAGTKATFIVTASGVGTLSYQWQKDGNDIEGATENSYSIEKITVNDAAAYRCVVSNEQGSTASDNATLTVGYAPAISAQPVSVEISADGNATFSISATGTGALSYQWQKDGVNISGGTGVIIRQYYPQYDRYDRKWLKDDRGMWFLLFSDGTLKDYLSDEVKGKFDSSTWNNPWKLIGPNHFTIAGVKATDAGKYRCVVSNAGSTTSNEATLTVLP